MKEVLIIAGVIALVLFAVRVIAEISYRKNNKSNRKDSL